jgi:tripartite-type tricarboxylate transporter receptor subunit TctC
MKRTLRSIVAVLGVVLLAIAPGALAAYPEKPIRLIVVFPAGGMTDVLGRLIAQKLTERLGQSVVVDNRAGMAGSIGVRAAAAAEADGYTLVLSGVGSFTVNTVIYKDLGYDPLKDFEPVVPVAAVPNFLVVAPNSPYTTLAELIEAARAQPEALTYASSGIGASPYLSAELLKVMAKVSIREITYKGGAPALIDVIAGRVSMGFDAVGTSATRVKAGQLRALGVTSIKRVAAVPEIPTIAEQGYPGFDVGAWYGIWTRAGTPPEAIRKINAEVNAILKLPDVIERMNGMGAEIMGGSVEAFAAYHRSEFDKWTTFMKNTGIKPQ